HSKARYLAATAAHISHMLRDTFEDAEAGYFNIPGDVLEANGITPQDISSDPYRAWVRSRVRQARVYFNAGRDYLAQVQSFRCRMAGYAYIARFEWVLDAIEMDEYILRPRYVERKQTSAGVRMVLSAFLQAINRNSQGGSYRPLSVE
ncbi:MAG: squalene/phytoene synthase family protein, partial [Anaerolineales bacterium]